MRGGNRSRRPYQRRNFVYHPPEFNTEQNLQVPRQDNIPYRSFSKGQEIDPSKRQFDSSNEQLKFGMHSNFQQTSIREYMNGNPERQFNIPTQPSSKHFESLPEADFSKSYSRPLRMNKEPFPDKDSCYSDTSTNHDFQMDDTSYNSFEEDGPKSILDFQAEFDRMVKRKKPLELIMEYREKVEEYERISIKRVLKAIEKVSSWNMHDISQSHVKCFHKQREEFESYITKVKHNLSSLSMLKPQVILQKAGTILSNVKNECKLFNRFLPGYSLKSSLISNLRENQVVIISSDPTYYLNVVSPILLKQEYPDHIILCCETSKLLQESLKINVTSLYPEELGEEILFFCAEELLTYILKDLFIRKSEKDIIFICKLPLKRSVIVDMMVANLKDFMDDQPESKLVLLLSPYDKPEKYEYYFSDFVVNFFDTEKLSFPVSTVWKEVPLLPVDDYVEEIVKTVISIHALKEEGDIMAFVPTVQDATSALVSLRKRLPELQISDLNCALLHEKSYENSTSMEWLNMCYKKESPKRQVFFVTECAESFVIPSLRYVVDCGLRKELMFDANKKLDVLTTTFISCDKARLRKKLAGSFDNGVCYYLYSKENYRKEMTACEYPEILTLNPFNVMLKLFEYQPNTAVNLDFVESIPSEVKQRALELLKKSNAVKENKLTPLGERIIKLPFPPMYSKLISVGIEWNLAYEVIVLVAFFSVKGRLFQFHNDVDSQRKVEYVKVKLLRLESDTLSYLYIYKLWLESNKSTDWCNQNFINSEILKQVNNKVDDICSITEKALRSCVVPEISMSLDTTKLLLELLFDCFQRNLCVFTGHYRSGYRMLSSRCIAFLHPSSMICETKELPQFIIFDHMISTKRDFLVHITTIPEDMVMNALTAGVLDFDYTDMFENNLVEKVIEPVGERMIKQVLLGKKGHRLKEIEQEIKATLSDESLVIEPSAEKGRIAVFATEANINKAAQVIENLLQTEFENILNSSEVRVLKLEKDNVSVPIEIKWQKGGRIKSLKIVHSESTVNEKSTIENNQKSIEMPYSIRKSINLTWIRRKCIGKANVIFSVENFRLVQRFIMKQIPLLGTHVFVSTINHLNECNLLLTEIPENTTVANLKHSLKEILPPDVTFERVEIKYEPSFETSEKQLHEINEIIEDACRKCTELIDFQIVVPMPKSSATIFKAYVNVAEDETIDAAANCLSKNLNNLIGIMSKPVFSSSIKCSAKIWGALKVRFLEKLEELEQICFDRFPDEEDAFLFNVHETDEKSWVLLKLSSNQHEILLIVQRAVYILLEGDIVDKQFHNNITKLLCHGGLQWLKMLEDTLNIHIMHDYKYKSVRLYGSKKYCHIAKQKILQFLVDSENEAVKLIPLATEGNNRILLKTLLIEYGINLENFITSSGLRLAVLDIKSCTLSVHGDINSIEKAESILTNLASSIDLSSFSQRLEDEEICPVCACPALNLAFRLEMCGHLYCCECILGLVDQAHFPILCCMEGCNKEVVLYDLCKILSDDDERIDALLEKSMKIYIEERRDQFSYCPAPDCQMFFNKEEIQDKHRCPLCMTDICTKCNVIYHHGLSCKMYQGSKNDPDYSFKVWKEAATECKRCPRCNIAIEKNGGCDHMTCQYCRSHFCWICLKEFSSAEKVYEHIPYCTNYPNW